MIGNQLILELKSLLSAKCGAACADKLKFHYLNMPLLMRARGGLGTHWKMPSSVSFHDPASDAEDDDRKIILSGAETICLIQGLFANNLEDRSAPEIKGLLTDDARHVQCAKDSDVMKLPSVFLEDKALSAAWGGLIKSLQQ